MVASTWARTTPATPPAPPATRDETSEATSLLAIRPAELQERLWAEDRRSLLLVLQALDAGGKDGTVKHVFRGINPAGMRIASFKQPSDEELAHDFLWRVHVAAPARGEIGVFNRSHYEDVLIARVAKLVPEEVWRPRFDAIWAWEAHLAAAGTEIVKIFLHISPDEQAERFQASLDDPSKHWKQLGRQHDPGRAPGEAGPAVPRLPRRPDRHPDHLTARVGAVSPGHWWRGSRGPGATPGPARPGRRPRSGRPGPGPYPHASARGHDAAPGAHRASLARPVGGESGA